MPPPVRLHLVPVPPVRKLQRLLGRDRGPAGHLARRAPPTHVLEPQNGIKEDLSLARLRVAARLASPPRSGWPPSWDMVIQYAFLIVDRCASFSTPRSLSSCDRSSGVIRGMDLRLYNANAHPRRASMRTKSSPSPMPDDGWSVLLGTPRLIYRVPRLARLGPLAAVDVRSQPCSRISHHVRGDSQTSHLRTRSR